MVDRMVRTAIVALSAVALISLAPAVLARAALSRTPANQHHVARKHHPGASAHARWHEMRARGAGYPGAFGYAPPGPNVSDPDFARSRQFGGGGGGSM